MQTAARLTAFAAGLAVVGGAAAVAGGVTGANPPVVAGGGGHGMDHMSAMAEMVSGADGTKLRAGGLTLQPRAVRMAAGTGTTWRFRIVDDHGNAVRRFERDQTKLLHLIVARTDMTGYQHLHPVLGPDGTFSVRMRLPRAGRYRAIADFTTNHRRYVLGTDLVAPGHANAVALPAPAATATVDGYDVSLMRPDGLVAGKEAPFTFTVTRDRRPVSGLRPYLGAAGHLVALHAGDLAYSHVHPTGKDLARGSITFDAELEQPGAYRLFVQFRTADGVHTAAFTQKVESSS